MTTVNALTVEEAVRAFAADNQGRYPENLSEDISASGTTVIDLLPDGQLLLNPHTGERTEPRDRAASRPGEVGYLVKQWTDVITDYGADHANYGYQISAWGGDGELVALDNTAELEAAVIENARILRDAVRAYFAEHNQVPPAESNVIDLLLGGEPLRNPITHRSSEPSSSGLVEGAPGSLSYTALSADIVGYGLYWHSYVVVGIGTEWNVPVVEYAGIY